MENPKLNISNGPVKNSDVVKIADMIHSGLLEGNGYGAEAFLLKAVINGVAAGVLIGEASVFCLPAFLAIAGAGLAEYGVNKLMKRGINKKNGNGYK